MSSPVDFFYDPAIDALFTAEQMSGQAGKGWESHPWDDERDGTDVYTTHYLIAHHIKNIMRLPAAPVAKERQV